MTLNGTPFPITPNLEAALLRLRHPDTERILWVDALFSSHLTRLGVQDEDEGISDWIRETQLYRLVESFRLIVLFRRPAWEALYRLLSRPWFQRAWTLQKLVVSRGATIPWPVVELAIQICDVTYETVHQLLNINLYPPSDLRYYSPPYCWPPYHLDYLKRLVNARSRYRFLDIRNVTSSFGVPGNFSRAHGASSRLALNMTRNCYLAYDKIYSVLGILPSPLRDAMAVDYSVPARTVYLHAVKACIDITR
jgi:hypothetical protein